MAQAAKLDDKTIQIAFLADIHLHDIYAQVRTSTPRPLNLPTDKDGKPLLMRSMAAQLGSTRLFNENYLVLTKALNDLVRKKVKLVALPGDFTDDGQPINVLAVKDILDKYSRQYGMQFFVVTGNHDPVRPFTVPGGKSNFLQATGQEIGIYSPTHNSCATPQMAHTAHFCSGDMQYLGYQEIMSTLSEHGFMPKAQYLHYETPFSYAQTGKEFSHEIQQRTLRWCPPEQTRNCVNMPDASYLVEPSPGLWLLAIDANVYLPKDYALDDQNPQKYEGSSNAGYNAMFEYKKPVLDWITSVVARAKVANKQLVAFSHYPMTDFYDGASANMQSLFGQNTFQMKRLPNSHTESLLANTGLQLHFAGHMHINDTGTAKSHSGSTLFNIQVPSLAAYQPAYKLLTLSRSGLAKIETIVINKVPNFNLLFEHYLTEWHFNHEHKLPNWNKDILSAKSYAEFTDKHLQGVVTQRYIPSEWPKKLVEFLRNSEASDLVALGKCSNSSNTNHADVLLLSTKNLDGLTLIYDFYRVKNADHLSTVPTTRKAFYLLLHQYLQRCSGSLSHIQQQMRQLMAVFVAMIDSQPSANFTINLTDGTILSTP